MLEGYDRPSGATEHHSLCRNRPYYQTPLGRTAPRQTASRPSYPADETNSPDNRSGAGRSHKAGRRQAEHPKHQSRWNPQTRRDEPRRPASRAAESSHGLRLALRHRDLHRQRAMLSHAKTAVAAVAEAEGTIDLHGDLGHPHRFAGEKSLARLGEFLRLVVGRIARDLDVLVRQKPAAIKGIDIDPDANVRIRSATLSYVPDEDRPVHMDGILRRSGHHSRLS